ncbi:MAG TPA: hypothetical protein VGH28_33615 [Polyangiaceae bacterium]
MHFALGIRRTFWLFGVLTPALVFSCVGDDSGTPDGSTGADAADGTTGTDASGDGSSGDSATCVPGCVGDASTLRSCNGGATVDTPCPVGCLSAATPHCGVFNPTGLVEPGDFSPIGIKDFDPFPADAGNGAIITGGPSYLFYTDTGQIEDLSNGSDQGTIRPANSNPSVMQVDGPTGIGFRLGTYDGGANSLGIFVFKNLYFRGGEFHFTGSSPVAFVAQQDILVSGVINVVDTGNGGAGLSCGSAAGGAWGGAYDTSATGLGGGEGGVQGSNSGSGGGGGGSGAAGSVGGNNEPGMGVGELHGGAGGAPFSGGFDPLLGGGGGGGGGGLYNGSGGTGGGAIALFANGTITISQGVGKVSGVNAGGCGAAGNGTFIQNGGGGAGGAILVQAPRVVGLGDAGLAANGGSGGCNSALGGARGAVSLTPAPGTPGSGNCGAGGNGGAGTTAATAGQTPSSLGYGGGGGGAVGRIQISTYAPLVEDGGFVVSPPPSLIPLPVE